MNILAALRADKSPLNPHFFSSKTTTPPNPLSASPDQNSRSSEPKPRYSIHVSSSPYSGLKGEIRNALVNTARGWRPSEQRGERGLIVFLASYYDVVVYLLAM